MKMSSADENNSSPSPPEDENISSDTINSEDGFIDQIKKWWRGDPIKPDRHIIIGPKASGKTVFFVSAVDLLLRSEKGKDKDTTIPDHEAAKNITEVEYMNTRTADFVRHTLSRFRLQKWPAETSPSHIDDEPFLVRIKQSNFITTKEKYVELLDYPGNAFITSFSKKQDLPPAQDDQYNEVVQLLRDDLRSAAGVFVLLDSCDLLNGGSDILANCLSKLVDFLNDEKKPERRIAVLFTKKDLILDPDFSPENELRTHFRNEWGKLHKAKVEFFEISSVQATETNSQGEKIPVRGFNTDSSQGLLEALLWGLGFLPFKR